MDERMEVRKKKGQGASKNLRIDRRLQWVELNQYIKSQVSKTRDISGNNRIDFAYLKAHRT